MAEKKPDTGFLCITRYIGEGVLIGENTLVFLSRVNTKNQAVIAIKAPKDVNIVRVEMLGKNQDGKKKF